MMQAVAMKSHTWSTVGNGRDRFHVQLRTPSYDDLLTHHVRSTQYALGSAQERMQIDRERIDWCIDFVENWRDVDGEDGVPVPFSKEHLQQLIVAHPRVMLSIVDAVEGLLSVDLTESQRGN